MVSFLNTFDANLTNDYNNVVNNLALTEAPEKVHMIRTLREKSKNIDPNTYIQYVFDMGKGKKVYELLPHIEVPSLLLVGNQDAAVNVDNSQKINQMLIKSKYVEIYGAGHYPYVTHSSDFNQKIKEFLG
jgi:pimeloyl-ACP methyl ester carboxylesterase